MSFIVGRLKILSTTFLYTILHQLQIIQFTLNFKFIKFQQILSYPKKHRTLLINIRSNISKIDDSNRRLDSSNNFNRVSFWKDGHISARKNNPSTITYTIPLSSTSLQTGKPSEQARNFRSSAGSNGLQGTSENCSRSRKAARRCYGIDTPPFLRIADTQCRKLWRWRSCARQVRNTPTRDEVATRTIDEGKRFTA